MTGHVFINYRRADDAGFAQLLHRLLKDHFETVFIDVNKTIGAGDDFARTIRRQVSACDALVIVIGVRWAEELRKRRDAKDDFVVLEIEMAEQLGNWIAPVLVGGATMPKEDVLPPKIGGILRRHAVSLRPETFETDAGAFAVDLKERIVQARDEAARLEELRRLNDDSANAELATIEHSKFLQAARRAKSFARENVQSGKAPEPSTMSIWSVCSPGSANEAANFAIHLGIALNQSRAESAIIDLTADRLAERWADMGARQHPIVVHGLGEQLDKMLEAARNAGVARCVLILPGEMVSSVILAWARSDLILFPVQGSPLHLLNLNEGFAHLRLIGASRGFKMAACRAVIVGTRITERAGSMLEVIETALGQSVHVCRNFLGDRPEYDVALRKYQGITEHDHGGAARQFKNIVGELAAHERRLRGYL